MAKEKLKEITFENLSDSIRRQEFKPLYYFFGEEDYLIDELIKLIISEGVDESLKSFNLDILDASTINVKDLVSTASAYPMMAERRIVVVRDFNKLLSNEKSREILERYFENPPETTILVMIGNKLDNRTTIAKKINEKGIIIELKTLYDNQIPPWIKKQVKNFGKKITDEAADMMAQYVGNSMREINTELEKLSIFLGDKEIIKEADVSEVVGVSKSYNIFALQNSIGEKDTAKAMVILENMLENGESPLGIIVMLTKYFQKLWAMKGVPDIATQEITKIFGINPYFVNHYKNAVNKYKMAEIENAFSVLVETDEALKTSKMEEKLAMTLLIHKLIKS